jgi:UDP-2-acetamido-3-amino-2,3-dideoxy-glucuronate N-acetyltransferase
VVGNPARLMGWISELGHRLKFDSQRYAVCQERGEGYMLKANEVIKLMQV